ncbi:hypothetical protein CXF72_03535 [Psychromonas sp. MB-3u-54]|uniref:pilin n=1 Tax=Psychromonas sp. MB-3u-54 TaxID=2058319 RepID=UPI000C3324B1|nr:hypothetical protein [Psychromonas sp. MB-3u-54]PKH03977.1 hypothetical protein CXF72_03535 [Psychromonas sp. MB-3u-54]
MKKGQQGFTLTTLLIVTGILPALALLSYKTYKAKFSDVFFASSAIKSAVEVCYAQKATVGFCNSLSELVSATDIYSELRSWALIITGTTLKISTATQKKVEMVALLLFRLVFFPSRLFVNT